MEIEKKGRVLYYVKEKPITTFWKASRTIFWNTFILFLDKTNAKHLLINLLIRFYII